MPNELQASVAIDGPTVGRPAVAANADIPWQTVRPHPGEGMYYFDSEYGALQATELMSTDPMDTVPMPTNSNDDMYRQYRVTVTAASEVSRF